MMMLIQLVLGIFFGTLFTQTLFAADETRLQLLTQEIRCVVCQNQNIADSNAPLAKDLREKIAAMILEKKSNDEIKDYLVKRYGEFILFEPRLKQSTWLLWLFPFLGPLFAAFFVFNYYRKTRIFTSPHPSLPPQGRNEFTKLD